MVSELVEVATREADVPPGRFSRGAATTPDLDIHVTSFSLASSTGTIFPLQAQWIAFFEVLVK